MTKTDELLAMVQELNAYDGSMEHLEVFYMDEFNEIMQGMEPIDIAMKASYGDFNVHHDYFRFNGYGNLESVSGYLLGKELLEYESEIRETYKETFEL